MNRNSLRSPTPCPPLTRVDCRLIKASTNDFRKYKRMQFNPQVSPVNLPCPYCSKLLTISNVSIILSEAREGVYSVERVIETVSNAFSIKLSLLLTSPKPGCKLPRRMAMHALKKSTDMEYQEIGMLFGKNLAVAIREIQLFETLLDSDKKLQQKYSEIKKGF